MAVNLSGKADATLVAAAKGAAMANVPVDVSRIHERISKSRAAMTKSIGKSWGNALKAIGEISTALVQTAKDKKDEILPKHENYDHKARDVETSVDITPTTIESDEGELIEQLVFNHYSNLIMLIRMILLQLSRLQIQKSM